MPSELTSMLSGLVVGFVGSAHCVGMCGPIALALPLPSNRWWHFMTGRMAYNLGRTSTYALMGLLMGYVGNELLVPALQQRISIIAGSFIVLTALAPATSRFMSGGAHLLSRFTGAVKTRMAGMLGTSSATAMFGFGILNGLLPCGFVYVAVAAAGVIGSTAGGMLFMSGFGFGTIPALLTVSLFPRVASQRMQSRIRRMLPILTVIVGILLIIRGLNLGIPLLSPDLEAMIAQRGQCH